MRVEAIAMALDGRRSGSGWVAYCPAHEDHHPSLSISCGTDGKVLVHCHAGCSQDSVIGTLRQRGLLPSNNNRFTPHETLAIVQSPGLKLEDYAVARKLPKEFLQSVGIKEMKQNGKSCLRIPYFNETGVEFAVQYRISASGSDRFRWAKGAKLGLYGQQKLEDARKDKFVVLVEDGEAAVQIGNEQLVTALIEIAGMPQFLRHKTEVLPIERKVL